MKPIAHVWAAGVVLFFFSPALVAAPPTALPPDEIQKARENLKLSEETRDRIAGEVAGLKASGKASPEVVAAYEVYLARVREIVLEHQRLLAQMEAAVSAHAGRPPAPAAGAAEEGASSSGAGTEAVDRLQELDRQFNESLAAFDEMLLKELRLIQAASAQRMRGLTEAAAKAGRQAGEKGQGSASAGKEGAEGGGAEQTGGEAAGAGSEQAKRSEGRGKPGEPAGGSQEGGGWGPGGSGAPPSSYTPSPDDDIVARQLREAAEKETDPELKAKLWKEYEAYKKSQAKP